MENNQTNTGEVMRLVRQTAQRMADLVGQHVKLARLEIKGDVVRAAKQARSIVLFALVTLVGYTLAMAGLAVLLGGSARMGVAFLLVGSVHLVVGGLGLLSSARGTPRANLMNASSDEVKRSTATLAPASVTMENPRAL